MEQIHEEGVKAHSIEWVIANEAARDAAGRMIDYSDRNAKVLISRIVLAVLNSQAPRLTTNQKRAAARLAS